MRSVFKSKVQIWGISDVPELCSRWLRHVKVFVDKRGGL